MAHVYAQPLAPPQPLLRARVADVPRFDNMLRRFSADAGEGGGGGGGAMARLRAQLLGPGRHEPGEGWVGAGRGARAVDFGAAAVRWRPDPPAGFREGDVLVLEAGAGV